MPIFIAGTNVLAYVEAFVLHSFQVFSKRHYDP